MSAARRPAGLTRHLTALGHRVTVLTSSLAGAGPVPGAVRTVRTRDLMASRLNWRSDSFAALSGASEGSYARPSPLASVPVPDLQLASWAPFALAAARRLAVDADVVVTTSPPASSHLVGLALAQKGLPWVADFRDGWRFDRIAGDFPLLLQRRLDAVLESAAVRRAQRVVGVTSPITEDLVRRHGVPAVTITNGFDPDERVYIEAAELPLRPDRHSLVYTGTLAYGQRSAEPLARALRALKARRPDTAERLEVVVAGPRATSEAALFEDPALEGMATAIGNLPHWRTLALQCAADSLLLVAGEQHPSIATGKLYEYLAARRPILVLGARSAAARIVRDAKAGLVARADDPEEIVAALLALVDPAPGQEIGPPAVAAIEPFSYARLAERYAEVLDEAITAARRAVP